MPQKLPGNRVQFSEDEVDEFIAQWPCCRIVSAPLWFEFDSAGNLIDLNLPEAEDGEAGLALADDARAFLFDGVDPEWLQPCE